MGQVGGYDLPYFSKEKLLTKNDIIIQFNNDPELAEYLPDHASSGTITRSFLLALLYNVKREKYMKLYESYKQHKKQISIGNKKIYHININDYFIDKFKNYESGTK